MTIGETYSYLGQIRGTRRKIEKLDEQITELRYSLLPSAIRYDKDRVKSSPEDGMIDAYSKIQELELERKVLINNLELLTIVISNEIFLLPISKERTFLLRYYIHCQSMDDIAEALGITTRHCFRIRGNAVSMFSEVVK